MYLLYPCDQNHNPHRPRYNEVMGYQKIEARADGLAGLLLTDIHSSYGSAKKCYALRFLNESDGRTYRYFEPGFMEVEVLVTWRRTPLNVGQSSLVTMCTASRVCLVTNPTNYFDGNESQAISISHHQALGYKSFSGGSGITRVRQEIILRQAPKRSIQNRFMKLSKDPDRGTEEIPYGAQLQDHATHS